MRPTEVLRRATTYLERHGVEAPRVTAERLLQHALGTDRAGLYTRSEGLSAAEARAFGRALCRRCTGTPLQHLTGGAAFRRLELAVRPGVFVPRPETEVLVDAALNAVAGVERPVIVDVGTGTGAVALSLKQERPEADVHATDVSPAAVALARENAARLGLHVVVHCGDLLAPLPPSLRGRVDVVVSNPPYVTEEEYAELAREVLADPRLALVGGIEVHERLAVAAQPWLRPGGALVVEIGATQGPEVRALLERTGFIDVEILPDLAGRDRVVRGTLG